MAQKIHKDLKFANPQKNYYCLLHILHKNIKGDGLCYFMQISVAT